MFSVGVSHAPAMQRHAKTLSPSPKYCQLMLMSFAKTALPEVRPIIKFKELVGLWFFSIFILAILKFGIITCVLTPGQEVKSISHHVEVTSITHQIGLRQKLCASPKNNCQVDGHDIIWLMRAIEDIFIYILIYTCEMKSSSWRHENWKHRLWCPWTETVVRCCKSSHVDIPRTQRQTQTQWPKTWPLALNQSNVCKAYSSDCFLWRMLSQLWWLYTAKRLYIDLNEWCGGSISIWRDPKLA